jgi:pimeloyl-ACP methyl ester carboxylesterase
MANVASRYVMVQGIKTHYLEAGEGPTVVLLHAGEFGGCAEISWEFNIEALSRQFRVVAPDFVGFGRSDKLRDFGGHGQRMIRHITDFLEQMCIDRADFIGNSISGRFLCRVASAEYPEWPIRRMISVSGGGFEPDNEERRILQNYDATREGMQGVLRVLFHNSKWWSDEGYLKRRHELSLIPGAWEVAAASRFKSPVVGERPLFGRPDRTPYEKIRVPVLFVAGANDRLLQDNYWKEVAGRAPKGSYHVFDACGHCPHIEYADEFNELACAFFRKDDEA